MEEEKDSPNGSADLRRRAEELARKKADQIPENLEALSPVEARRLFRELRVHQIELEMQNEELHRTQGELEASRARYFDLYDMAPVGYFTMGEQGQILEANLTAANMLRVERSHLVRQPLTRFILREDQDIYYRHRKQLFETGLPQVCELRMLSANAAPFWIQMDATVVQDADGASLCRTVVSAMSERKRVEEKVREQVDFLETLFDTIPNPIFHKDANGRYTGCNRAFLEFTGKPMDEILGKTAYDMGSKYIADKYAEKDQELFEHPGKQRYEWQVQNALGDVRQVIFDKATLLDAHGVVTGLIGVISDITERRRTEEALRESEETLRYILKYDPNAIAVYDSNLRYLAVSDRYLQDYNVTEKDVIGKQHYEVFPEMPQRWKDVHRRVLAGAIERNDDDHFERPDGSITYNRWECRPWYGANGEIGGMIFYTEVTTERKLAEEALSKSHRELQHTVQQLEQSRNMLQLVVESIPVRVFWKGRDLRYWGCNTLFARDAGLSRPEQLLGLDDFAMGWMEQAESYRADDRHVMESGIPKLNFVEPQTTPAGAKIWLNTSKVPLHMPNGEVFGVLGVYEDITERKRAEEERRTLQERLHRAEKMEALGTLAGGVAHDLNNVLGIVVGYSELLLDDLGESSSARSEAMEIQKAGQRAAAIVQDLLTLTRRGVPSRKVFNLNNIIVDCQESPEFVKALSYHRHIRIKTDLEADLLNISGSSVHLGKSFLNLVSNAAEAMSNGGTLTIKTRNQYLDRAVPGYDEVKEGDYVVLSISDTGEGIPAGDLKRIFEPFYTKKVMGRSGTGLGLAVVWGTVKDHLGYINVESEEGKGTTFTLYFPVTREESTPEEVAVSASEYMGNGESILVVDDVREQRNLASTMLTKLNYSVSSVSSGEDAVKYLKQHTVDLVVLDMIMEPGMDGLDTYFKILEIHPHQKAIIVSGFSETERVTRAQELGAGAYVKKPYVLEKLGLALKKGLERST
jgi:PAS domain S-box-containing protein